jgi:alkanesulfonate monooxygenase SsuD/methylene tetrahydromethanopterin reductase-like flavin-dependent oxidoreductase (luciferase family)
MLAEGVEIFRQAWTTGRATLTGTHYQVDGAIVRPLPLQEGGIPLWIAGGGEQKTLRIAAQYARYTNFDGTPETFRHKSQVLARHCADLGRDYDSIVRSANYNVVIGADEAAVQDRLRWIEDHYRPYVPAGQLEQQTEMFRSGPLVGTPSQVATRLRELQDLGMTYAILNFPEVAYDTSGVDLFVKEVIPQLAG